MHFNAEANVANTPTSIRLPKDVRDQIAKRAADNHRSLNGELLAMIEDALAPHTVRIIIVREHRAMDGVFDSVGAEGGANVDLATVRS